MEKELSEFPAHEFSTRRYVLVYVALLVLTLTTWGLARVELGAANLVVVLGVALAKALLVIFYFMHLREEKGVSRLAMLVALIFVAVLILFTLADLRFRFPLSAVGEGWTPVAKPR